MFDSMPIITGLRDIGHAHVWSNFFVRPLVIPHRAYKALKSLAQVVLGICSPKLKASRDLGHVHFQRKLFVRPLIIPDTKLHNKFEVSISSSFRDIAL